MKNKGKITLITLCFVFGSCVREIIPINITPEPKYLTAADDSIVKRSKEILDMLDKISLEELEQRYKEVNEQYKKLKR